MSDDDLFDIHQGDPIMGPTAPMPIGKQYVPESQQVKLPPEKKRKPKKKKSPFRWAGVPVAFVLMFGANDAGLSIWGWGSIVPLLYVSLLRGWKRWIEALVLLAVILGLRVMRVHEGPTVSIVTMPGAQRVRVVNQLVEEGDLSGLASAWLPRLGSFPPDENTDHFHSRMSDLYGALRDAEGYLPSTVPATYLGMQSPQAFDLVRFSHAAQLVADDGILAHREPSTHSVLFLHGSAGSSMGLCWLVAKPARTLAMRTYCPSVGPDAAWTTPEGRETILLTMDAMREEGAAHVHLVGLSAGGVAASRLAIEMADELASVTVISGAAPDVQAAGIPTAVIHGARDAMMPIALGRAYAERAGVEMLELPSGHFALIDNPEDISHHLVTFWRGLGASDF